MSKQATIASLVRTAAKTEVEFMSTVEGIFEEDDVERIWEFFERLNIPRSQGGEDDLMALDDFLLWIHVREVAIAWTVFSVWIGAIGLSFVSPQATPEAALIVGYSLDSFIDVVLLRFEAKAGSVAKSLAPRG